MVDSRSLNAVTPASSFNFKSGDISGTAAKMSDEKMEELIRNAVEKGDIK